MSCLACSRLSRGDVSHALTRYRFFQDFFKIKQFVGGKPPGRRDSDTATCEQMGTAEKIAVGAIFKGNAVGARLP